MTTTASDSRWNFKNCLAMSLNDSTKGFTGRMAQLHDTTENWNALRGFLSAVGDIIIYDYWKGEIVGGKKLHQ